MKKVVLSDGAGMRAEAVGRAVRLLSLLKKSKPRGYPAGLYSKSSILHPILKTNKIIKPLRQ